MDFVARVVTRNVKEQRDVWSLPDHVPQQPQYYRVGSNPYACGWQIVGLLRNVLFFKMSEYEWEWTMWEKCKALSHHAVAKEADPTWSHH